MNTIKRLVLGILSSLLLTAGFAQAAVHLDSTTTSLHRYAGQPIGEDDPPPPPPPPDDGGDDGGGGENGGGN